MPSSRRQFLQGAAGLAGLAALYANRSNDFLNTLIGTPGPAHAQSATFPANRMGAELPPVSNQIVLNTPHLLKEVAPGLALEVWSYEGSGPGPHLHVREGETVSFTMNNTSDMTHSIDFHAAQIAWDKYYQGVEPGTSHSFEWTPGYAGVYMYHCGTPPVLAHIGNGMHGAIIVSPKDGWPEPAREYVLVQHEWYIGNMAEDGARRSDMTKMNAGTPDLVVFNGYFNQYMDAPLVADPGELVRLHVCNCGPTVWSAFHVIGALFDASYADGNPANKQVGMQTVTIPPGGGYTVELRMPEEGLYPFVTHSFAYTGRGALGLIKVGNPTTDIAGGSH